MRKEQAELENIMIQEMVRQKEKKDNKKNGPKNKAQSSAKVAFMGQGQEIQIQESNKEYQNLGPAGKMRANFKETRRFESTYEV